MVKKQDSPRQLHVLREVKRKAQADQEARLQQTLLRISQQEARFGTSTQRRSTSTTSTFYKYYAVRRGRVCNVIYSTWAECKEQVHQFPGAEYKSFPTYREAQVYLTIGSSNHDNRPPITSTDSDSESDTNTPTEAEPEQVTVARNNDFRDGVFFGFLLGALFILWTLRLR